MLFKALFSSDSAKKEDNMFHQRKSTCNSFRRTIKEMEKEVDKIDDQLETLIKTRLKP